MAKANEVSNATATGTPVTTAQRTESAPGNQKEDAPAVSAICIKCWDDSAIVSMNLDGSKEFQCSGCDETFTCADVRTTLNSLRNSWDKLITWAESYPLS